MSFWGHFHGLVFWCLWFAGALLCSGCGAPQRRPDPVRSVYTQVGLDQRPEDAAPIQRSLTAWDAAGWPPQIVRVDIRDAEPQASAEIGEPGISVGGRSGRAFAVQDVIVCTRGRERWIVHEMLHVQQWREGHPGDGMHQDGNPLTRGRWPAVDALARSLP